MSRRQALGKLSLQGLAIRVAASLGGAGAYCDPTWPGRCLYACEEVEPGYRVSIPSMGSLIEVRWIGGERGSQQTVAQGTQSCADHWVSILSDYEQDSECMKFCREAATDRWITVSESLWRVLLECDRWYRLSEGAFDASLGALTRLRRSRKAYPETAWQDARSRCGWEHLELDREKQRVRLRRSGVILDFGAIGKGFVVDRIGEQLRAIGIEQFMINASGNMLVGEGIAIDSADNETSRSGWPVSIGALQDSERELKRLRLVRSGIATSGDQYQRFRDGNSEGSDNRSSHILDPVLRRGLETPNMATVITARASDADALATACSVHMNRGTISTWLARVDADLPRAEYVFQTWRDGVTAYTSVPCDW